MGFDLFDDDALEYMIFEEVTKEKKEKDDWDSDFNDDDDDDEDDW